jgi:hypothetical protein
VPTDLSEIVRAKLAVKARSGRSPSRADLAWLDATAERAASESSVELSRNAKGEMQFTVKAYSPDPLEAERLAKEIANRLRATYPMHDGTVGAPMTEPPKEPKT